MTDVKRNGERGVKRKEDTEGEKHCGDGREIERVVDLMKGETEERKEDCRKQIGECGKNKKRRNRRIKNNEDEKRIKEK